MSLQIFTSARAALEVTRGTDLTPTRLIYGESFGHEQMVATVRPEELRGSYEGWFSASAGKESNTLSIGGRQSFDDMIWYGNLFWAPLASGTGGGADKTWLFTPSNTLDNVKTATIQLGYADNIAAAPGVKLNYCMGDSYHMHWEKNDDGAVLFDASFATASAAAQITAFTGSLSDRTVIAASSTSTTVFLDTTTIGTTVSFDVQSVDFTLNLQPVPFYGLNGLTTANAVYRPHHRAWTATIVRQYVNTNEWTPYNTKVERKVRIKTLGPALGGSNYMIQLDLYGVYTARTWTDTDGIITETLTLEPFYDTGVSASTILTVVNATSAIT